jgi:hypothetical protein
MTEFDVIRLVRDEAQKMLSETKIEDSAQMLESVRLIRAYLLTFEQVYLQRLAAIRKLKNYEVIQSNDKYGRLANT